MSWHNSKIKTHQNRNAYLSADASPAVCRRKGGNKTNNEYGLTATFQELSDKWNVKSTGLVRLHSADRWGNCSFTYCAFSCVQLHCWRYCSVLKRVPKATMLSCWCGLFFPTIISSKQGGKKDTINANIKEVGEIGIWKKVSVYTDISRASPSRYEKDILIQAGITDSKKLIKLSLVITSSCAIFFQKTAMLFS